VASGKAAVETALEGVRAESADGDNPYRLSPATEAGDPGNTDVVDAVDGPGNRPGLPHAN
jgi:hypothetical protein